MGDLLEKGAEAHGVRIKGKDVASAPRAVRLRPPPCTVRAFEPDFEQFALDGVIEVPRK